MKKIIMFGSLVVATILFWVYIPNVKMANEVISENQVSYDQPIPSIAHGYRIRQDFTPVNKRIDTISIYIDALSCSKEQGYLDIKLLDKTQQICYENQIPFTELPDYGWVDVVLDVEVTEQATYALVLESMEAIDDGPKISFYASDIAACTEEINQPFLYADIPMEECVLRMRFTYQVELVNEEYIILYLFVMFLVSMLISSSFRIFQNG